MKKVINLILFVLVSFLTYGQTPNTNYKHTVKYKEAVLEGSQQSVQETSKVEQIVYFDGLGRPFQAITPNAGGNKEEIISHFEYDIMGRQAKNYLPYAANQVNSLELVSGVSQNIGAFYQNKFPQDFPSGVTPNPYSETVFEKSPAGKVLKQGAPGNDWKINSSIPDHSVKFVYGTNLSNDVYRFDVIFESEDTKQPKLIFNGYYNKNELSVQTVKNENWISANGKSNTTDTFKDKSGKIVLVRTYDRVGASDVAHNTYYVYDDFGNLTYVISPKGATEILVLNTFTNFVDSYPASEFNYGIRGVVVTSTGEVSATVSGLNLTIDFNLGYNRDVELRTGHVVQIASSQPIPDMYLGMIGTPGAGVLGGVEYRVYIKSGYVYIEGFGRVSSVVKTFNVTIPEYSIDEQKVKDLCYQYKYDLENRLMEKKIPGKEWESIVYDKLNRPLLSQDANLKLTNRWLFVKYDTFGRIVYTGEYTDSRSREQIQIAIDNVATPVLYETRAIVPFTNQGATVNYTNNAFPVLNYDSPYLPFKLLSVIYYDDHNFDTAGITPLSTAYSVPVSGNNRTLVTGSKVRVLDTTQWMTTIMGYDEKARPISVQSKNDYLQTTDIVETKLDFVGKVEKNRTTHSKIGVIPDLVKEDFFAYDHADRLEKHTQKIGTNPLELISYNKYNDLGELVQQKVGDAPAATYTATAGLQTIDYGFNVRGWLTKINDPSNLNGDLFAYEIKYNKPTVSGTALYNGNISQTFWKTDTDNKLRNYSYTYDNLNRIKKAQFSSENAAQNNSFNLESISYDKNGNILFLHSEGDRTTIPNGDMTWMDYLTYTYDGNKLLNIVDTGHTYNGFDDHLTTGSSVNDYNYDANGNLTADRNKDITSISYNYLNLPVRITFGTANNKYIDFVYNAAGVKQSKKITEGSDVSTTYYAGAHTYKQVNGGTLALEFIAQSQGYTFPSQGTYKYVYQYKDQVGNVRLSYTKDQSGLPIIVEENNYSPFGVKHTGYGTGIISLGNSTAQKYKYNGKEYEEAMGLNVTEMDFRQYDANIGRFYNIDLLAEATYGMTPNNFAGNNPINASDPSGLKIKYYNAPDPNMWAMYAPDHNNNNGFISWFGNHDMGWLDLVKNGGPGGHGNGNGGPAGYGFGTGYNGPFENGSDAITNFGTWQSVGTGHFEKVFLGSGFSGTYQSKEATKGEGFVIGPQYGFEWIPEYKDIDNFSKVVKSFEIISNFQEHTGRLPKGMKFFKKFGPLGNVADYSKYYMKYNDPQDKDYKSSGRLAYRFTGVTAGAVTPMLATYFGSTGPQGFAFGLLVGIGFDTTEAAYDIIAPQIICSFNGFINNLNNAWYQTLK